jgi:Mce-associated membrane protein
LPTKTDAITEPSVHEPLDEASPISDADGSDDTATGGDDKSAAEETHAEASVSTGRSVRQRILIYAVMPALVLILTAGAGYLKWQNGSAGSAQAAATESTQAATDSTIAMLSYAPDSVDKELPAVGDRLTGKFRDEYTSLINDVVIPGAKQQKISAVAKVPAAASVSATRDHAVVLVFIDQTITIGDGAPTNNASSVRVTLDKVHDRWLISQFEPI